MFQRLFVKPYLYANALQCCTLWLIASVGGLSLVHGQSYIANVQHVDMKQGLSHREVYDVHQDHRGFIWLATAYGLNRFDGKDIQWVSKEDREITQNTIHKILEDAQGYLWTLTFERWYGRKYPLALNLVNSITGEYSSWETHFKQPAPFRISDIVSLIDDEGRIICLVKSGWIWTYHPQVGWEKGRFFQRELEFINAHQGHIWVREKREESVGDRLLELDADFHIIRIVPLAVGVDFVKILGERKEGGVYYLSYWEEKQSEIFYLAPGKTQARNMNSPLVDSILKEILFAWDHCVFYHPEDNTFWFKADGIVKVTRGAHELIYDFHVKHSDLTFSNVHRIFFDREGFTWFATGSGVYRAEIHKNVFSRYLDQPYNSHELLDAYSCRGIWADQEHLLVNTYKGQIWVDIHTGRKTHWPISPQLVYPNGFKFLPSFFPHALLKNSEGGWWFGDYVLNQRSEEGSLTNSIFWPDIFYTEPAIWSLYEDKQARLWVGALLGLSYLDPSKGQLIKAEEKHQIFPKKANPIYAFVESKRGHIWLATESGLYAWHPDRGILGHWHTQGRRGFSLPHDRVYHVYEENKDLLWVATGGAGLVQVSFGDSDTTYQQFSLIDGFSDATLYAVYPDEYNNLWLSSNYGINRFDRQTLSARAYLPQDGLTHHEFNRISHFQAEDGTLYFGGVNGVTAFHPRDVHQLERSMVAPLRVTGYYQFDGSSNELEDRMGELLETRKITLDADDRFFRLEFALLEYSQPDKVRYAWKLEGLDQQWNVIKEDFIRLSGIPAGEYTLWVKGQAANGQWANEYIEIDLKVLSPLHEEPWFWAMLLIVLSIAIAVMSRLRSLEYQAREAELERMVETRTQMIANQAEALKELDKLKSQFFADVSHELRTPLTLMMGPISSLLRRAVLDEKSSALLRLAQESGEKLQQYIQEILELARMEAGSLQLKEIPVDLILHLTRKIAEFESLAQLRGLSLSLINESSDSLYVLVDLAKFEVIINNLLSNAMKFTPGGGTVSVHLREIGNNLELKVIDTGVGIAPEDLPNVFNRFYQSEHNDAQVPEQPGTGIGLALAKEYAALFQGELKVESERGKGSHFIFTFPKKLAPTLAQAQNSTAAEQIGARGGERATYGDKQTSQLLLVEDNPSLRGYIGDILREHYKVETYERATLALAKLEEYIDTHKRLPALIISDIMMPEMDGHAFLEQLKQHPQLCRIPVIMLTARADLSDKLRALRIGVDDYMLKPFVEEELLVRVGNLLQHAQERKAAFEEIGLKLTAPDHPSKTDNIGESEAQWLIELEEKSKILLQNFQFNIDMLAGELNMSRRQAHRKIKLLTGLTPNQYIQELRLQKARFLLETQALTSVKAVAHEVGMKDAKYFSQKFKARFGKLPSDYVSP